MKRTLPVRCHTRWNALLRCLPPVVAPLAILASSVSCYAQDAATGEAIRAGAQQMQSGHYAEAEGYFRTAAKAAPDSAEPRLDLGLALMRQGKLNDAVKELDTAASIAPELQGVHLFLGISYYQMHRLPEAISALQREVALSSQSAEAFMWLGIAELGDGSPEKAVGPLDRASELSPKDLNILDYRGQAHGLVAKNSYSQMYKLAPRSWHVHRLQAELYAEQDRHREAIAEYLEAIHAEPGNADLYEGLGGEYRKTSQLDLAHDAYENELKLSPGNGVALYNLGSIDVERDDAKDGVPLLEQVNEFYGNAPVVTYYLGRGLAQLGKDEEAAKYLQQAINSRPSSEIAERSYFELHSVYRRLHKVAEAQQAISEYLRLKQELDKASAKQLEDWKVLNGIGAKPAANGGAGQTDTP